MDELIQKFRVLPADKINLANFGTNESSDFKKEDAKASLKDFQKELGELQERLYAEDRRSVLIIFQAMDAAGKDSAIKHVMSGVNPQGCQVFSFKQPNSEDYEHDFLWRHYKALPERGRIGIHNRSHYEYALVCKVHPEYIFKERLPGIVNIGDITSEFWDSRYESIRNFENHLSNSGTTVIKFFLHVSQEEQKARFLDRIEEESKNWKFSSGDLYERALWKDYMSAYEDALSATSTEDSPWYVIPADKKWFSRMLIGKIIVSTLKQLNPQFPKLSDEEKINLEEYKRRLEM